jgi:hypothetical protein
MFRLWNPAQVQRDAVTDRRNGLGVPARQTDWRTQTHTQCCADALIKIPYDL